MKATNGRRYRHETKRRAPGRRVRAGAMIRIHAPSAIEAARFARAHVLMTTAHVTLLKDFLSAPEMMKRLPGKGLRARKIRRDASAHRGQNYLHAGGSDDPMLRSHRVVRAGDLDKIAAAAKAAGLSVQLLGLKIEKLEFCLPLPWGSEGARKEMKR